MNYLWRIRKKVGFSRKEVASILGHKDTTQLCRYERQARLPCLRTALKLAVVYSQTVEALFLPLREELKEEIRLRKEALHKDA